MARPILKWAGGKRQILDEIKARFPKEYNHYHEPMLGGGALFFDLEPQDGSVNDTNERLVNFYEQVKQRPEDLIDILDDFRRPEKEPDPSRKFSEQDWNGKPIKNYYYQQRALFNRRPYSDDWPESDDDRLEEAALLLYLNRTAYNGLYRENSKGGFNVPEGRYSNPDWVQAERIEKASRILDGTGIFKDDFEYLSEEEVVETGDLVYIDPPYQPMSPTADFTEYSEDGFDKEDQVRLLEFAQKLSDDHGANVILSNSGILHDMYSEAGFHVDIVGATRAINSDADNRGEVDEIIATNIPPNEQRGEIQKEVSEFS